MLQQLLSYLERQGERQLELLGELCRIPAPCGGERARAEYIMKLISHLGPAELDGSDNAIFTGFDTGGPGLTVICAHTDTVFPDREPFEPRLEGNRLCCPGVGDDTANVSALLVLLEGLCAVGARAKAPVVIAFDSGEEGLGNLRGARALMERYGERCSAFISLDGGYRSITTGAVGSHRYRITVSTPGGHSYGDFGNRNAIAALSELICRLYAAQPPAGTTYNVGTIEGGTSVNTIAQSASALFEYRSDSRRQLELMEQLLQRELTGLRAPDTRVELETLGVRPCSGELDPQALASLAALAERCILAELPGGPLPRQSASTDCNIPLSMGIPAVCFGLYSGCGAHTRQEYLLLDSLPVGLRIGGRLMGEFFR